MGKWVVDVHFEAFQISDVCVRLFKDGWFETEIKEDDDPKLSIGYDSSSSLDQNQQWVVVAW